MSTFSAALGVLGLSIQESALYLDLPEAEVERLCTYSGEVGIATWFKLADLYRDVMTGSVLGAEEFDELGVPDTVYENYIMGNEGMPAGAAAAAGAMAVLNLLLSTRLEEPGEG